MGQVTINDTIVEFTITPSQEGWNYAKVDDPGDNMYRIVSATRHDAQEIPLKNIWLTYSTVPDGGEPIYENKLHIVDDFESTDSAIYTIVFEPIDQDVPAVIAINGIPEDIIDQGLDSVHVVFNEPIDPASFTHEDMVLKCQGGENLMDSLVGITQLSDTVFKVDISEKTFASGYYVLTVQAAGVTDLVGNYGVEGVQVNWIQAIAVPAIDLFVGIPEDGVPVDSLLVLFNMPIDSLTFTNSQLRLFGVNGDSLSVESLTITPVSINGVLYRVSGLLPLTTLDGSYELQVKVSEVVGENGVPGVVDQSVQWTVCQIPIPVANAGMNDTICIGQTAILTGVVENDSAFIWTTSGTGSFDDDQSLVPIYTPGQEDIENGSVEISLTAYPLNACASPAESIINLIIYDYPQAIATEDGVVCEDQSYSLTGYVENAVVFNWVTAGDGLFDNEMILTPSYTPGLQDIENGMVEIYLIAQSYGGCLDPDSSKVTLLIQELPVAYAGPDTSICEYESLQLSGLVMNESSFVWSSNGDGTFDSQQSLSPVYTPGTQDIENEFVELSLTAQKINPCENVDVSTLTLTINRIPTVDAGAPEFACQGFEIFFSEATGSHYDSLIWSTDGIGYFDDPHIINPIYYPVANETGTVTFSVWAFSRLRFMHIQRLQGKLVWHNQFLQDMTLLCLLENLTIWEMLLRITIRHLNG